MAAPVAFSSPMGTFGKAALGVDVPVSSAPPPVIPPKEAPPTSRPDLQPSIRDIVRGTAPSELGTGAKPFVLFTVAGFDVTPARAISASAVGLGLFLILR